MLTFKIISILHNSFKLVVYLLLRRNCTGREHVCKEVWSQTPLFKMTVSLISCRFLGKLPNFSVLQFPPLWNRDNNTLRVVMKFKSFFCVKQWDRAWHIIGVNQYLLIFPLLITLPCTEQVFNRYLLSEWMTGLSMLPPGGSSTSLIGIEPKPRNCAWRDFIETPSGSPRCTVWRKELNFFFLLPLLFL